MPYSIAVTTASGSTALVSVPFKFLDRSHVHVLLNGVPVDDGLLTWITDGQLQLPSTPTAGTAIKVYRTTPLSEPIVVFDLGDLDPNDLNTAELQSLYASQEAVDGQVSALSLNTAGTAFDAQAKKITNAAPATADGDVVVYEQIGGFADDAETAAGAAHGYANAASASATAAAASASAASNSATLANLAVSSANDSVAVAIYEAGAASDSANASAASATSASASATAAQVAKITWRGPWVTSTAYVLRDAVQDGGSSYVCKLAHTSGASSEPGVGGSWTTYWDLMASKGSVVNTGVPVSGQIPKYLDTTGNAIGPGYTVGTGNNNIPQLTGAGKLPAVPGDLLTGIATTSVPKRQTVLTGPANSDGTPNFWPATSASLTLTAQNLTTAPLVATIATGYGVYGQIDAVVRVATNIGITLPASSTSYVWLDGTGTLGSTTLKPIYQRGGTISVTNGQHTYDITAGQMYVGNGSSASVVSRVFIGEAVTGSSTVTSTAAYAYLGRYFSGFSGTLPSTGTQVVKTTNIGVEDQIVTMAMKCLTAEGNYSVGDIVRTIGLTFTSGNYAPVPVGNTANTAWFTSGAFSAFVLINKTTGGGSVATAANWAPGLYAERSW